MHSSLKGACLAVAFVALACCHQSATTAATSAPSTNTATVKKEPPVAKPPTKEPASKKSSACASSAACGAGEHCSTEDGVCLPPPDCKPGDMCAQVCYGTCVAAAAPLTACRTDADCQTVSVYCDGCRCEAALKGAPPPVCQGKKTACLVDPCAKQAAVCKQGRCFLSP